MIKELFRKKKSATIHLYEKNNETKTSDIEVIKDKVEKEPEFDSSLYTKCKECGGVISNAEVERNMNVCPKCGFHMRTGARKRISFLADAGSFVEYDKDLVTNDILDFPDYMDKVELAKIKSSEKEGLVSGEIEIKGAKAVICVMNPEFMMGSMGAVVGEKITRAVEKAIEKKLPLIISCASGGARMQEGIVSLMQMAKTSAALKKLSDEGLLYVSLLTNPTTGGVTASFAMLGDIILAEPKALIAFAGPRVIEQTIRQKLPEGFQRSEFLKDQGFVDKIVDRRDLKDVLHKIIRMHMGV